MAELTPQEINEILDEYFNETFQRTYIGKRYVPIFGRKGESTMEWDNDAPYEPLTIVLYEGNSYTSRQYVPIGAEITDTDFWVLTGNYNAQVEEYRQEVESYTQAYGDAIDALEDALPIASFDSSNTVEDDLNALDLKFDGLFEQTVVNFDTVADMKASTILKAGMICHTNGFRSVDDGGASFYSIKSSGTANEMNIIACGELKAHLLFDQPFVKVEQFGAYGDGTHDDVDFIQAATNTLKPVYFGSKTYAIGSSVLLPKSDFIGNNTIIKFVSGDNSEHRIKYENVSHIKTIGIKFDTSLARKGIGIFNSSFLDFEDCFFEAGTFEYTDDVWNVRTLDLYTDWHDIKISRCKFNMVAPNAEGGLWIRNYSGTNGASYNCIIEDCDFNHCTLDECVAIWSEYIVENVTISNCSFKCNWSSPLFFQISGVNTIIENCDFELTQGYTTNRNPNNLNSLLTTSQIFVSAKSGSVIPSSFINNCNINYTPDNDSPYINLRFHDATTLDTNDNVIFNHCKSNYGMRILKATLINCEFDKVAQINYAIVQYCKIKYQQLSSGQMSQGGIIFDSCNLDLSNNAQFLIQALVAKNCEILNCVITNAAQRIFFTNEAVKSRFIGNIIYNTSYDIAYCGSADGVMICVDNILYSSSSGIATQAGDNKIIDNNLKIAPSA